MAGELVNNIVEELLAGLSLQELQQMERDAERDFRRSKTPQELHDRQYEWRCIEAIYLKRLTEHSRQKNEATA